MARYLRTNNVIDNDWKGNNLSTSKDVNTTRLMFHNVNGMSLTGIDGLDMFIHEQTTLDVDIQGISEHCLDTSKFQVHQDAQDILQRQYHGQSMLQLNSSQESALNVYKPGGTGFLALGDIVSRLESQGRGGDPMGRWSDLHFQRRDQSPVTLISAYQVCPRPTNLIGNTAYHQQLRALSNKGFTNIHPRQAFIRDLEAFILQIQSKGHDIILGGDFNESLEDKHSGILRLTNGTNLTDPFLHFFPYHQSFGTHILGSRRIDSVYVTPNLMRSIKSIGYAPFQYAKPSDHRPLLIDFDTKTLFGYREHPLQHPSNRIIKSKDRKAVTRFISRWFEEISKTNAFALQSDLDDDDSATPETVEIIDAIMGKTGDIAEQACRRRRPEYYSQQIVQQRLRVSILRGHLRSLRMGANRNTQLRDRMRRGGLDFTLPSTIRHTTQALRQASQDLHNTCREHSDIRQAELASKIDEAAMRGNRTKAKILRSIKKVEMNQRTYQLMQKMKQRTTEAQQLKLAASS